MLSLPFAMQENKKKIFRCKGLVKEKPLHYETNPLDIFYLHRIKHLISTNWNALK